MPPKDTDSIINAATQANTANEYRMSGKDAVVTGVGGSEPARNFAQAMLANAAAAGLAVGAVSGDPLSTGAAAMTGAVVTALKGKGWSMF